MCYVSTEIYIDYCLFDTFKKKKKIILMKTKRLNYFITLKVTPMQNEQVAHAASY